MNGSGGYDEVGIGQEILLQGFATSGMGLLARIGLDRIAYTFLTSQGIIEYFAREHQINAPDAYPVLHFATYPIAYFLGRSTAEFIQGRGNLGREGVEIAVGSALAISLPLMEYVFRELGSRVYAASANSPIPGAAGDQATNSMYLASAGVMFLINGIIETFSFLKTRDPR